MVDNLANPKEALQHIGLPRTDSIAMKFSIHFTSAPELARLNCWYQLHTVETLDLTPIKSKCQPANLPTELKSKHSHAEIEE